MDGCHNREAVESGVQSGTVSPETGTEIDPEQIDRIIRSVKERVPAARPDFDGIVLIYELFLSG